MVTQRPGAWIAAGYTLLGVLAGTALAALVLMMSRPSTEQPVLHLATWTPAPRVVHVTGAVRRPGVYTLPPESRVHHAIQAAGGLLPDADAQQLNLAQPVRDGMKLYVPRKGERVTPVAEMLPTRALEEARLRVNINTATAQELETLPGIGPKLAQRIVEYRERFGPFRTIEDLLNVSGIGPAKLKELRPYITVGDTP